jgi:Protein of unknown function (DUF664)
MCDGYPDGMGRLMEQPSRAAEPSPSPDAMSPEMTALLKALASQRHHVLGTLEGLPDEVLRRSVLPSGWVPLGLVRHLALDVERFWFRAVVAGETVELETGDAAWQVPPGASSDEIFALYRQEIEIADAVIATRSGDSEAAWWPEEIFPGLPRRKLRQTMLHVITETACHAGHLDAVRELTDGRLWLVITE